MEVIRNSLLTTAVALTSTLADKQVARGSQITRTITLASVPCKQVALVSRLDLEEV